MMRRHAAAQLGKKDGKMETKCRQKQETSEEQQEEEESGLQRAESLLVSESHGSVTDPPLFGDDFTSATHSQDLNL